MNIRVLGTPDDVRGFALAGVAGLTPASAQEVEERLAEEGTELILVSAEIAALAPQAVATALARGAGAEIVLLPEAAAERGGDLAHPGERGGPVRGGA